MKELSIGDFARRSRLSPKALRLYDELGLLVPARVDPATGYRWYEPGQLDTARLIAELRRIGMPLARIGELLSRAPGAPEDPEDPADAASPAAVPGPTGAAPFSGPTPVAGPAAPATVAAEVRAYWVREEAAHAARRQLASHLVERLNGRKPQMSEAVQEVAVRDVPARSLLSVIRRVHEDELVPVGRELLIRRLHDGGVPRPAGPTGAPFMVFYGEVSADSDGPVEWCWPVPDERAEELAAAYPEFTLRTEPAHREAYVPQGPAQHVAGPQAELAVEALRSWATAHGLPPSTGPLRLLLTAKATPDQQGPSAEFAVPFV